jgi:hypothetical protein
MSRRLVMLSAAFVLAVATMATTATAATSASVATAKAAPNASAKPKPAPAWTEAKAERMLHGYYRVVDMEEVNAASGDLSEAKAGSLGLRAEGASAAAIAAAYGGVDEAEGALRIAARGYAPRLEFCDGVGKGRLVNYHPVYPRFRCNVRAIGNHGWIEVRLTMLVEAANRFLIINQLVTN